MSNGLATTAEMPDEEAQRRELYRQQMAARIGQPLPQMSTGGVGAAETTPPTKAEAAQEPTTETGIKAKLTAEQAREKAGAGTQASAIGGAVAGVSPLAGGVGQTGKSATAKLLHQAWLNLITSFGLTYFYIAFHFICRYIGQLKSFCRFGEEWLPGGAGAGAGVGGAAGVGTGSAAASKMSTAKGAESGNASAISKTPAKGPSQGAEVSATSPEGAGGAISTIQNLAEFLEFIAFGLMSLIVLFIIFAIGLLIYAIVMPCKFVAEFFGLEFFKIFIKLGICH